MTPAPHVPISFIKAGGGAFFSTRCIALLAEYGYEPEDFGTYDSVLERLRGARKSVEAHENRRGPAPDPRTAELGRPLSDPDHYQSGHMGMNTCMQRSRDESCSNFVTGHDMGEYPCMPHQGNAMDGGSEHNRWTVQEVDQPLSEGGPRSRYPASDMEGHADQRVETLLRNREQQLQEEGRGQNLGRLALGTPEEKQQALAEAEEARRRSLGGNEALPEDQRIDGRSAAECLSNFRKAGVEAMRHKCREEVEKNEALARGENPSGTQRADMPAALEGESPEAYRQRLREDATAAEADAARVRAGMSTEEATLKHSKGSWAYYKGRLRSARRNYRENPTRENYQAVMDHERDCGAAQQRHRDAQRAMQPALDAEATASASRSVSDRAEAAHCRAQQGDALARDPDIGRDGRRPSPWNDLPRDGGGGGDTERTL